MLATLAQSHVTNYRADFSHRQSNSYSVSLMLKEKTNTLYVSSEKSFLAKDQTLCAGST